MVTPRASEQGLLLFFVDITPSRVNAAILNGSISLLFLSLRRRLLTLLRTLTGKKLLCSLR